MSRSAAAVPGSRVTARVAASVAAFVIETPEPEVPAGDRFFFAAFLAVTLHAAVILGIGFVLPDPPEPMRSLEVTLAQFASEKTPVEADFLAQTDQQGSGTLEQVREVTTNREAPLADMHIAETLQPRPERGGAPEPVPDLRLNTQTRAQDATATTKPLTVPAEQALDSTLLLAQARDLASLEARRSRELQLDARGRRVRRLTSVSARSATEAAYLESWRNKIERIGNLNYPLEARRRGLEGDLRVFVEIDASGRLLDVRILESSGSGILDASALRTVRLAAPFLPFPDGLRAEVDVLQIVRTWQFRRHGFGSG